MIKSPNQSLNTIHRYVILFLIHAPAKGATLTWIMFLYLKKYFNPRSREGSDLFVAVKVWYPMKISIHAPAKGATCKNSTFARKIKFQSTLPRRERPSPANTSPPPELFQSTLPRRERLFPMSFVLLSQVFQSTLPRRERQVRTLETFFHGTISIHAPAKGATRVCCDVLSCLSYFNPRSREGSDLPRNHLLNILPKFQSTLPRRERLLPCSPCTILKGFQSTLPRRERQYARSMDASGTYFNPRSREGSDYSGKKYNGLSNRFQSTLPRRERRKRSA